MNLESSKILPQIFDRIVCPVCHERPTTLLENSGPAGAKCSSCQTEFERRERTLCFVPLQFSDAEMREARATWEKIQTNGLNSYTLAPEFNLSVEGRKDALEFAKFSEFHSNILDIGCGPSVGLPSYLSLAKNAVIVGMDPLESSAERGFPFVAGIGEYLPFRDQTFDHISFASSLDHCLSPLRALKEAKRCLKPDGSLNLWIDGIADSTEKPAEAGGIWAVVVKGWRSLSRHDWIGKIGWLRTFKFIKSVALMQIPTGASDPFHLGHFTIEDVLKWLDEVGFKVEKIEKHPQFESVFIKGRPVVL